MNKLKYLFILLALFVACKGRTPQPAETTDDTAIIISDADKSKFYTTQDTVVIFDSKYESIKYCKEEFNAIVDDHPEFYDDLVYKPDWTYHTYGNDFGSEAGQDGYYVLYAYFLRQQNGVEKYAEQRQKLTEIYLNINHLFQQIQGGGTYFGHQYYRIPAYAEYGIYELAYCEHGEKSKTYDIGKQKDLYIQSLRQLIKDENEVAAMHMPKEDIQERNKELQKAVDEVAKNIIDFFYLRKAQEFQYSYYGYFN